MLFWMCLYWFMNRDYFVIGQSNRINHHRSQHLIERDFHGSLSNRRHQGETMNINAMNDFNTYAIKVYKNFINLRNKTIQEVYGGNYSLIRPWEGLMDGYYLWDYFYPAFNCPARERLGKISEGGKIVCNPNSYREIKDCTIFSFGVRTDVTFEIEMAKMTNCTIFTFDPSVKALPDQSMYSEPCTSSGSSSISPSKSSSCGGRIHFDRIALDSEDMFFKPRKWNLRKLLTIMNDKKVNYLHLLKVDIEGSEWNTFLKYKNETLNVFQRVDQLLIELHFPQHKTNDAGPNSGVQEVFELFQLIETAGLYAFSSEVNHNPSGYHNRKPHCIEYSFIRPFSIPMIAKYSEEKKYCQC